MLKEITKEEADDLVKETPDEQVVIFNERDNQWYDIRGMSMEEVGSEIQRMCERGVFNKEE